MSGATDYALGLDLGDRHVQGPESADDLGDRDLGLGLVAIAVVVVHLARLEEPDVVTRAGCERLILAALDVQGVHPNVCHDVSEAPTILAMVGEGLGVSVMPSLAAPSPPPSSLCAR